MSESDPKAGAASEPASAEIIIFPFSKRIGRARHIADLYSRRATRSEHEAEAYWKDRCNDIWRQLRRLGCTDAEVGKHLTEFRELARSELTRRAWQNHYDDEPDGAA